MIICDTNIIIELFKNNDKVKSKIKIFGIDKLAISAISAGEFYFGSFNKE